MFYMVVMAIALYFLLLDRKNFWRFVLCSILGFLVFLFIFPYPHIQIENLKSMKGHFYPNINIKIILLGLFEVFSGYKWEIKDVIAVLITVLWLWVFINLNITRLKSALPKLNIFITIIVFAFTQYILGISPPMAIGVKYIPLVIPFLTTLLWLCIPKSKMAKVIPAILIIFILSSFKYIKHYKNLYLDFLPLINSQRVIVDQYHRGLALNVLYVVKDNSMIIFTPFPKSLDVAKGVKGEFVYVNLNVYGSPSVRPEDFKKFGIKVKKSVSNFLQFYVYESTQ